MFYPTVEHQCSTHSKTEWDNPRTTLASGVPCMAFGRLYSDGVVLMEDTARGQPPSGRDGSLGRSELPCKERVRNRGRGLSRWTLDQDREGTLRRNQRPSQVAGKGRDG